MIKTEELTINGKEFVRTYSDSGLQIERDGALYDEAIDPVDSGRTYVESDQPKNEDVAALFERYGVEVT